ncbi:PAS fold-containing protein [Jatrophihabitans endophyticus]|uniref:PAS fold-containing protein n=1 Tax=Jatrophihabitans endophyticus TaxID=1206085 RepID=A0A1M5KX63_9ACTN|nr:SpoIIE family protein phosphatase [Jatrophihabitans endophyticus]SHG57361.1 PAS fold-containing protein [Jatrophihabitans endophyticus]
MTGADPAEEGFVAPGVPIDLDNCAREPIHIPGSIQPRGVLLVVREPELTVQQVSANLADHVGVAAEDALERPLAEVLGVAAATDISRFAASFADLRARNPLDVTLDVAGRAVQFDGILHREPHGVLLVELEPADGPRPFSFPNTYQAVRSAVAELNNTAEIAELYDIAARSVRELTGFDRVMVYRYDDDYNGEVVAEAKRDDLNPFLGLHYPASDIPAQARALYERNWLRLISDVDYTPSPVVPTRNPVTGAQLDLTHATLRSVSPIHVEYLRNMGVGASMSISLLRDGRLWGLIACHHYSGPHTPPYGTRAAAEFLGSTLSLRLVDRVDEERYRARLERQAVLAKLTAATVDERDSLASALLGAPDLLDLVTADGVVVQLNDAPRSRRTVPDPDAVEALVRWARESPGAVASTDRLAETLPELAVPGDVACGALVVTLPDERYVAWFRAEARRSVDWGGDPYNKAIAVQEGDSVRLSPRKSFERWSEIVRGRAQAWTVDELDLADRLRRVVVEALFQRARSELRLAETLQRNLQPKLPVLTDWQLTAHYEPAEGGRIGGDWCDALTVPDGRLVTVLGDVAGHGIPAAGTMAQLCNALRAYLFEGLPVVDAVARTNEFAVRLLPGAFATVTVVAIDLGTGEAEGVSAGHPLPYLVRPGAEAATVELAISPPLGVRDARPVTTAFTIAPGESLVLFSDGLIERRDEALDEGRRRLAEALAGLGTPTARDVRAAVANGHTQDDATVVALRRPVAG